MMEMPKFCVSLNNKIWVGFGAVNGDGTCTSDESVVKHTCKYGCTVVCFRLSRPLC